MLRENYLWLFSRISTNFFLIRMGVVEYKWMHSARRLIALIVPTPADYEDGEFRGMMIGRGNRSTRSKPAPVPLCPTQIPQYMTGRNTGSRCGKPATNPLSYGSAESQPKEYIRRFGCCCFFRISSRRDVEVLNLRGPLRKQELIQSPWSDVCLSVSL
jgi:hypothetical protein